MKTFWTTFYSYKGGVGRSLAVANVAALLVKRGHKVVILDFDLEAPSLDSFVEFADAKGKQGVVEYVTEFLQNQSAPQIDAFVHPVSLPEPARGKLWIMPAGAKDLFYAHQLARIRWADLYDSGLGAPFVENWKLAIEKNYQPDYVLIDSRTGLTEIGGVCTTAFPDLVIMMFGLNDQNVQGTAMVARHIQQANAEKIPQLHFVVTPLPNLPTDENGLLQERFAYAEKTLGVPLGHSCIRYWPPAALVERLFIYNEPFRDPAIVQDHKNLCSTIASFNRYGIDVLLAQAEEAIRSHDEDRIAKISEVLAREYPNRAEALVLRSKFFRLAGDLDQSIKFAQRAFELDPVYEEAFEILVRHFERTNQADRASAVYERILGFESQLSKERARHIKARLAELLMSAGKFLEAAKHYSELLELASKGEKIPPATQMHYAFNSAESSRRAKKIITPSIWKNVILITEQFLTADALPPMIANRYEAMHIPYALIGDIAKAKDYLRKSRRAAEAVNNVEVIFTVRDYRYVSRDEFCKINDELMAALDRGELWDHTKLPIGPKSSV